MVRNGNFVCGIAQQDYGLPVEQNNKSPRGRFAGALDGEHFTVRYNDSFSEPSDQGTASLQAQAGRLFIKVKTEPSIGYLSLEHSLNRQYRVRPPIKDSNYVACLSAKGDSRAYLAELP